MNLILMKILQSHYEEFQAKPQNESQNMHVLWQSKETMKKRSHVFTNQM